jgi:peptide-methionine (S)-S-oxide reductase
MGFSRYILFGKLFGITRVIIIPYEEFNLKNEKMKIMIYLFGLLSLLSSTQCKNEEVTSALFNLERQYDVSYVEDSTYSKAYFASGCFWCVEAIYESVYGVVEAVSGYAGGSAEDANYKMVAAGLTDHAETVEVIYDTTLIDFPTLLKVFFYSHDPTTLNRQGPDRGSQYRSAIFYQNEKEKELAAAYISELESNGTYKKGAITTELSAFTAFYPAEAYHQDYEKLNPHNPYIQNVSIPRLKRFQIKAPDLLKEKK